LAGTFGTVSVPDSIHFSRRPPGDTIHVHLFPIPTPTTMMNHDEMAITKRQPTQS
jgi:hypothetical protein